jgi:ribosomal protein S18 acetylase RimI-like enzyme
VEPLDNWVWGALTGLHQAFAEGSPPAVRYERDVSVFAALPDVVAPDAWDRLAALVGSPDGTVLFRSEIGPLPTGWTRTGIGIGMQMVGPAPGAPRPAPTKRATSGVEVAILTAADVPSMSALVERTGPGPFEARTIELGTYVGARVDGELVAMAGQRMRIDGHTEISAVCTDTEHRGRGLAGVLLDILIDEIHGRGDIPFLHVLTSNMVAASRYASLGFEARRTVEAAWVVPPT